MTLDEALIDAAATFGALHRDIENRGMGGQSHVTRRAMAWIERAASDQEHRRKLLAAFLNPRKGT